MSLLLVKNDGSVINRYKLFRVLEFGSVNTLFKFNDDFANDSTNNHQCTNKFMNGIESSWNRLHMQNKTPRDLAHLKKMINGSNNHSVEAPRNLHLVQVLSLAFPDNCMAYS